MVKKAPGKAYRKEPSPVEIMQMFPDDATAERWFADARWPNGPPAPIAAPSLPLKIHEQTRHQIEGPGGKRLGTTSFSVIIRHPDPVEPEPGARS